MKMNNIIIKIKYVRYYCNNYVNIYKLIYQILAHERKISVNTGTHENEK